MANNPLELNNEGIEHFNQGDLDSALTCFNRVLELEPNFAQSWFGKGKVLLMQERYSNALNAFEKAIKHAPNEASPWFEKGHIFFQLGRLDDALEAFKKGADLSADDEEFVENCLGIGAVYYKRELYEAALDAFDNVAPEKLVQGSAKYWEWKGDCHYFLNQPDKALLAYARGAEENPELAILWQNRGNVYLQLRQFEAARQSFKRVSEMREDWFLGWCGMGSALKELGRHHEALECFDRALLLKPDYWLSWSGKAQAHYGLHQNHMALICMDRALESELDYPRGKAIREKILYCLN